jgi:hypothetical protein
MAAPQARPVLRELKCPQCSVPIQQFTPDAQTLICPKCHSYISEDTEGIKASSGSKLPNPRIPIKAGQTVTFGGSSYFVMGRVCYQGWDTEDASDRWSWNEWLLGSDDGRLLWLSLDENGLVLFRKLRIKEAFDPHTSTRIPLGDGKTARVTERYPARIMGAEGELTWRAKRGDQVFMIEGVGENALYSIQVSPNELEVHEGVKLSQDAVKQAFGVQTGSALEAMTFPLAREIGIICMLFALAAFIIAMLVSGTGTPIIDKTLMVTRTQEGSVPVTFETAGRPVIVRLAFETSLPENSFADVDVVVTAPDESETYVSLQEFWHETGVDEGEFWREQRMTGEDIFVPYLTGAHILSVALDETSPIESAQVRLSVVDQHISPSWLLGYAAVVGIIGALLFFSARSGSSGAILIMIGIVVIIGILIATGVNLGDLLLGILDSM